MVFGSAADSSTTIDSGSSTLGSCSDAFIAEGSTRTSSVSEGATGVFAPAVTAAKER